MLAAYFAMVRGLLESHGGVAEKFIGDVVQLVTVVGEPGLGKSRLFHGLQAAPALTETDLLLHQTGPLSEWYRVRRR